MPVFLVAVCSIKKPLFCLGTAKYWCSVLFAYKVLLIENC